MHSSTHFCFAIFGFEPNGFLDEFKLCSNLLAWNSPIQNSLTILCVPVWHRIIRWLSQLNDIQNIRSQFRPFSTFVFLAQMSEQIFAMKMRNFISGTGGYTPTIYTILHGIMMKSCEIDLNSQEISLNDSLRPDFFASQKYKAKNDDRKGSTEKERNHKSFRVCWWKKIHKRLFERK